MSRQIRLHAVFLGAEESVVHEHSFQGHVSVSINRTVKSRLDDIKIQLIFLHFMAVKWHDFCGMAP